MMDLPVSVMKIKTSHISYDKLHTTANIQLQIKLY